MLGAWLPALARAAGIALLVALLSLAAWAGLNRPLSAPDAPGAPVPLAGVAYSPQHRWDDARDGRPAEPAGLAMRGSLWAHSQDPPSHQRAPPPRGPG